MNCEELIRIAKDRDKFTEVIAQWLNKAPYGQGCGLFRKSGQWTLGSTVYCGCGYKRKKEDHWCVEGMN